MTNHARSLPLHRRTVLTAAATGAAAVAVGGGLSPASAATGLPSPTRRSFGFLDAMSDAYLDKGPTRLPQSYADQLGLFSTAFTYDASLALLAYLTDHRRSSRRRAEGIGDALLFAQDHDPGYADGRLRQAYNVGPYVFYDGNPQPDGFVRADGKANIGSQFGFVGTAVGDMAWAGIALANLAHRTRSRRHLDGAVRIGEWIVANATTDQPLSGYKFGVDGGNNPLPFSSTEHNIDVIGFFGLLHGLTGRSVWRTRQEPARTFLRNMWNPAEGFFYTGTNDGINVNKSPIPEDPQTWSLLALRSRKYARTLDWAISHLTATDTPASPNSRLVNGQRYSGITFSSFSLVADPNVPIDPNNPKPDPDAVWFEGTGHLAAALRERRGHGDEAKARTYLATIARAQDELGAGQTVGNKPLPARSGVVAATSPLHTGFGFGYYNFRHTGATSWYLLASARSNPYRF